MSSWPLSQDYNEAIQSPKSNFADPELRCGEAVANALGLPMPYSGNFADVYQVRCPDGSRWAVKCFTRQAEGLRERYQEISRHLRQAKLPFTVDFTYLEQGIRVVGEWYPVLKMEWVEGLTLNQFVGKYADEPALLEALLRNWGRMAGRLRAARVGHCDLQHGNVLLARDARTNVLALKLIDYDGMWVPALAGTKSGEVGHASYQHPRRLREQSYTIDVDRFPVLLIATALRALMVKGRGLWEKYDNSDNLLFREADLLAPLKSHLFLDLTKTGDALVRRMMDFLVMALRGALENAPLLEDLLPESLEGSSGSQAALRQSGTKGRQVPVLQAPQAASAVPVVAPPGQVMAFDFGEPAPAASVVAGFRPKLALAARMAGPPVWVWVAAITLLLFAVGFVGGLVLWAFIVNPTVPKPSPLGQSITNSIGMKLVLIPAGAFFMGSPENERGRNADEGPRHEVEITQPFYIGVSPVTRGQFAEFVDSEQYRTEAEADGKGAFGFSTAFGKWEMRPECTWHRPGFEQTEEHPVVAVSWNDAVKFCAWLSQKEGKVYELPTEAEWEYACRAGTTTRFWCGDADAGLKGNANIADASLKAKRGGPLSAVSWDDDYPFTSPVGAFSANAWGLFDMNGNIRQWCADGYGPYAEGHFKDPRGGSKDPGHVLRSGSWWLSPNESRSAYRFEGLPTTRNTDVGFRVVLRPGASSP